MFRKISVFTLLLLALMLAFSAGQAQHAIPKPTLNQDGATLSWQAHRNAVGYRIRWRAGSADWTWKDLFQTGFIRYTFTNADIQYDTDYEVQIRANDVKGYHSKWSDSVTIRINTPIQPLPAPQNLRVEGYTILWDAVANASNYAVLLKSLSGGPGPQIVTDTSYDIPNPVEGKYYVVTVQTKGDGVRYVEYGGVTEVMQFFAYPPPTPIPTAVPTATPVPTVPPAPTDPPPDDETDDDTEDPPPDDDASDEEQTGEEETPRRDDRRGGDDEEDEEEETEVRETPPPVETEPPPVKTPCRERKTCTSSSGQWTTSFVTNKTNITGNICAGTTVTRTLQQFRCKEVCSGRESTETRIISESSRRGRVPC